MSGLVFPSFDPVALSIGPLSIRWYALAYLAGFLLGWVHCRALAKRNPAGPAPQLFDDYLTWAVIGTILGGRLGYVLFYNFDMYLDDPLDALRLWHGGMSFHGGMLGVILSAFLFARKRKIPFLSLTDVLACATPIGLGFGRVANFINGELFGRVVTDDFPLAMAFPHGGPLPRHPSQLYEAGLEGLVLFLILFALSRSRAIRERSGALSGAFLSLYGVFRFSIEFFREPDRQLGFLYAGATMGQLLCLPMMAFGLFLIVRAMRRGAQKEALHA
ncbi:MAG: prolipoprotein diacylglyceryl transferase [Bdellovibrionales bacterium]